MLSQEEKQKIANRLNERIHELTCPMCHQRGGFIIAEGYFTNYLQDSLTNMQIGGASIPTIAIVCSHCGFVSQHALGALGLLPQNSNENPNENR
ncbi:MAG: hypothetical protein IKH59_05010 [Bacteroidaceae bacterium]|nr:hypothetical protein [Bacteroidaceae bacterium]